MKLIRYYFNVPIVFLLVLIPVGLQLRSQLPLTLNFESVVRLLGIESALAGVVLFSLNFILATRWKFVEEIFYGLNRVYLSHHKFGAYAFVLLLYHPIFLSLQYLNTSLALMASFFLPPLSDVPTWLGIIALSIVIILLVITFFLKLDYQLWKLTHKFIGVGLIIAFFHVLLIPSTMSSDPVLKIYILSVMFLGIIAYLYRTIFGFKLVKKLPYTVSSVTPKGADIIEVTFTPHANHLSYLPGQFVFMDVSSLGIAKEAHPFSLTSNPENANISLGIKSSGDYTETLKLLKVGSPALIEGPFGKFVYTDVSNRKQIWIAGGIGLTPFLSMCRSMHINSPYSIILYYSVSTKDELAFLDELNSLASTRPNLKIVPYVSKEKGRLKAETITQEVPDYLSRAILLCGPPPMMKSMRAQFVALGVKNRRIFSEEFSLR